MQSSLPTAKQLLQKNYFYQKSHNAELSKTVKPPVSATTKPSTAENELSGTQALFWRI